MNITAADVIREVRALANANPAFIYEPPDGQASCQYVHEGGGGCIVGQALVTLGVGPATLREHEFHSAGDVLDRLEIDSSPEESDWLNSVQTYQDDGDEWASAVQAADILAEVK